MERKPLQFVVAKRGMGRLALRVIDGTTGPDDPDGTGVSEALAAAHYRVGDEVELRTNGPAWERLRTAVRDICEKHMLMHKARPGDSPAAEGISQEHAPDCPACELRAALEGIGDDLRKVMS